MKITIKNPAPDGDAQKSWGDFHFGNALQRSLEAKSVTVFQDFQPNWSTDHGEDVVLVLHGLSKYQAAKGKINILWIISHPAMISAEELDAYDLVLTVSEFHSYLLREITQTPVEVARQCTDFGTCFPAGVSLKEEAEVRKGIVYVANSRGQRREMAQWIEETSTPVRVFGRAWDRFGIGQLVEKDYIPNSDLPELYRSSRLCLNDHWKDMRAFGFINNRIYDSLACGLPVLTDSFPEIRSLFGDALLYARNADEFSNKIAFCESNYEDVLGRVRETWNKLGALYTFDTRADELIHWINNPPARTPKHGDAYTRISHENSSHQALREFVAHEEEKSAYLEKLISDQTRLTDQARREVVRARAQQEEEKRAKDELREKARIDIKQLTERINAQEHDNHQLRNDLQAINDQLSDVKTRLQKEKNIRISLFGYAKSLRAALETVYKSRSWKITAPYRMIARAVYGFLRGKKIGTARIPDWPPSIADLDKPPDVPHNISESKNNHPVAPQQVPTGSLQNPVFADQIYGPSNEESKAASAFRPSQFLISPRFKRFSGSVRHQVRQSLLPIRRRLSGRSTQALRAALLRVKGKNSTNATQQQPDISSKYFGSILPNHAGHGIQGQPVFKGSAPEIENAGYWYDKAINLLSELESIQGNAEQKCLFFSKMTLQKHVADKKDAPSIEVKGEPSGESELHQKYNLAYWRSQAFQLHEELEYAKANLIESQG